MKTRTFVSILIVIFATLIFVNSSLYADKGSIPFEPDVKIFEPNQRALIAWNGWEEILLLTTDLHASVSTKVLEVIPLPSEPEVTKGDIEVFQKATELINEKLAVQSKLSESRAKGEKGVKAEAMEPAGEITFHEKIGAHDISVAHVLNNQGFVEWINEYLKSVGVINPQIPGGLRTVIAEYLEEGFRWFVFDVVQLGTKPKTNEAIQYKFETPFLYYPLRITRTEVGYTNIDLLILTPETEDQYKFIGIPEERLEFPHEPIPLTREELVNLFIWGEGMERYSSFEYLFFYQERPYLRIWRIEDYLSSFKKDLIVKSLDGSTELMDACFMGSQTETKRLIMQGVDVNERDVNGGTALLYATWQGQTEVTQLLIEAGADVNTRTYYGWTALMSASYHGNPEIAQLLITYGADVTIKDNSGNTALKVARESGHTEVARVLIERGAEVNTQDNNGHTALMLALQEGHTAIAKMLIEKGVDVNARDKGGHTALMLTLQEGHIEFAQLLIDYGADVNAINNYGDTALIWALEMGHLEIAKLLIEVGVDVNAKNQRGQTALLRAAEHGHIKIVNLLLEAGADVNVRMKNDETILMWALRGGHTKILQLLLQIGADVNVRMKNDETVLMWAAGGGLTEIVQLLLQAGADVNVRDEDGWTVLMWALRGGHTEIVQLLLQAGADVNVRDEGDWTALMWAAQHGHTEVVRIMLLAGTDVNAKTLRDALRVARRNGHSKIVQLIRKARRK
jgi:ankyrin repeat protein